MSDPDMKNYAKEDNDFYHIVMANTTNKNKKRTNTREVTRKMH